MGITRIAVAGAACPEKDRAVSRAAEYFRHVGYAVFTDPTEIPWGSDEKSLVIFTDPEPDKAGSATDGAFFYGGESSDDDRSIISAWVGHPHFRIIGDRYSGDEKNERLICEIAAFLGEPEPLEIERKYLIEYPDLRLLREMPNCQRTEIVQTYLKWENGDRARIRRRSVCGEHLYFHTVKKSITPTKRIEIERRLTESEYLEFLNDPAAVKNQLTKDRYCIAYDSQYFELDVYPFWQDRAVLEIELCRDDEEIRFPQWVKVIKEVTGDREYNNSTLAKKVSKGKKA